MVFSSRISFEYGTKDNEGKSVNSIERAIYKLGTLDCIEITTDRKAILDLIQKQDKLLHDEKYQISRNVPYRLLSSFIKEIDGNNPLWNQRRRLVAYFEMINKYNCLLYTIGPERGLMNIPVSESILSGDQETDWQLCMIQEISLM